MLLGPNSRTVTSIVFVIVASPFYPLLDHRGSSLSGGAQRVLHQDSTKASPGHSNDIVTRSCPGSSSGFPPAGTCLEVERLSSVCYIFFMTAAAARSRLSSVPSLVDQNPRSLNSSTPVSCPGWSKAPFLQAGIIALNFEVLTLFPAASLGFQTVCVLKVPVQRNQESRHHL